MAQPRPPRQPRPVFISVTGGWQKRPYSRFRSRLHANRHYLAATFWFVIAFVVLLTLIAFWRVSPARAQASPDGTSLVPNPSLTTRAGTWTFGPSFPGFAGYWYVFLNGSSAAGAGGHRMVVADGGKLFLENQTGWFVWQNGDWVKTTAPPEGPGHPPPPDPNQVTLRVGASEPYKTIASAVAVANADISNKDYTIEIAPATYTNEFFETLRPLTLKSMGGPVVLQAAVAPPNGKGIIVAWADLTVDGLTFQGASEPGSGNGAGIRDHNQPGGRLVIRNSLFTGNDVGVLTDPRATNEEVVVSNTKFINNGLRSQHALYVNAGKLTVTNSLFCGQLVGHNIKSRAAENTITFNEIYDGAANQVLGCRQGTSSLAIDIANGGKAQIGSNTIIQGPGSPQFKMLSYGGEGLLYSTNQLVIVNNTFRSPGTAHSTAIYDPRCVRRTPGSRISDNIYESIKTPIDPPTC